MLGIIIVAHGGLAQEYLSATEYIVGINPNVKAISVYPSDTICEKQDQIRKSLSEVNSGSGTVIVTDMHGSTPANLALKASKDYNCTVLFGANLPLLVKLIKVRNLSAPDAVSLAVDAGRKYIDWASPIL